MEAKQILHILIIVLSKKTTFSWSKTLHSGYELFRVFSSLMVVVSYIPWQIHGTNDIFTFTFTMNIKHAYTVRPMDGIDLIFNTPKRSGRWNPCGRMC